MTLYFIRHAPVINKGGYVYGDDADIDLHSSKERLKELAQVLPSGQSACWMSSGVDRAHKTAQAVKEIIDGKFTITPARDFREQNFGDLIGKKHDEIKEFCTIVDGKTWIPNPPNGENIPTFIQRVGKGLRELKAHLEDQNFSDCVVFTHAGTIRAIHAYQNNLPSENFINLDVPYLCLYETTF